MTRRTKKAWTKWRELISEQARSGQTVTAFCRERGLCRPYFFVWKKRLGEDTTTQFLEVQLRETTPSAVRDTLVEIRLQNGRSLLVGRGFDAEHVRALLAVGGAAAWSGCRGFRRRAARRESGTCWRGRARAIAAGLARRGGGGGRGLGGDPLGGDW